MKKSVTPISDLFEELMSQNVTLGHALMLCRKMERALSCATGSDSAEEKRNRAAERKRKSRGGHSDRKSGDISSSQSSMNLSVEKEREEKNPEIRSRDDWPDDYETIFWSKYPGQRKYDKKAVLRKLAKIRSDGVVWSVLDGGLNRFIAAKSDPKFIEAPMVWLNQSRWEAAYGATKTGNWTDHVGRSSPGYDPVAAAAARLFGGSNRNGEASRRHDSPASSANGMGTDATGSSGSAAPTFDLDLRANR